MTFTDSDDPTQSSNDSVLSGWMDRLVIGRFFSLSPERVELGFGMHECVCSGGSGAKPQNSPTPPPTSQPTKDLELRAKSIDSVMMLWSTAEPGIC